MTGVWAAAAEAMSSAGWERMNPIGSEGNGIAAVTEEGYSMRRGKAWCGVAWRGVAWLCRRSVSVGLVRCCMLGLDR